MGHTPEQRNKMQMCGAKKKNGQLCRAFAGQGTSHPGVGRCKFHLGNTQTHEANAIKKETEHRMIKLGMPIEVRPHEALLSMLYLASGHVAWLREEIANSDDLGTFEGQVLTQLYSEERDRVARVAEAALRAGIEERAVALAERYGGELAQMFRTVFEDSELALTPAQQERLPAILRRVLTAYEARPALVA